MSALRGVRVLELAEGVAGEYCGKLLADFGAEVIKLERPGCGSPTRRLGPFAPVGDEPERSGLFAYLNTNKHSLALDIGRAAGRETLAELVSSVAVVVDDHAPGWLAGVGLAPEAFAAGFPGQVLCTVTPFGQAPPEGRRHATDLTVFHSSGWGYHTPSAARDERPPLKGAGRFMASYESGLEAAMCVVAALYDRESSANGRVIDVSMQEVLVSRVDYVMAQMVAGDMPVSDERSAFDLFGPAGIFPCREGYAYIWLSSPAHWEGLRQLLGGPGWMDEFPENWLERACTPERVALCRGHIAAWLAGQDKHQAAAAAQELGVTLVAVNDAHDLQESGQYRHRQFFAEVAHPQQGAALYPTVPYRLSETPAKIHAPAPLLGQHSDRVLGMLRSGAQGVSDD